jgi:superoxide dismutase, Cu-Zn family
MRSGSIMLVVSLAALAACDSAETPTVAATRNAAEMAGAQLDNPLTGPGAPPATRAVATLRTPTGAPAGSVTINDAAEGMSLAINVEGLPPGPHGIHVHMTGRCDPPAFESAGAHWNPTTRRHGLENPEGAHAGDLPNLTVGSDGKGTTTQRLAGQRLAALLDADGAAIVVHARPDDQKTDPSGNSGGRIACGIVQAAG